MIQVVLLSPKSDEDQKKKVFTAIWHYIRPELVGFICANRHFFVWSSSAKISMGGPWLSMGDASPLQFKYCT